MSSIKQFCQGVANINSRASVARCRCGGSPQEANGNGHNRAANDLLRFASLDAAICVCRA
jgi:hypothetical protein